MTRDPEPTPRSSGRATSDGTRRFADRGDYADDHFTRPDELWLSSIALGTLRGDPGGVDDLLYRSVLPDFVAAGGNVIDTALSDRMQTSERAIGAALERLFAEGGASRDELVVLTKGGALTPEPEHATSFPAVQRDLVSRYLDSGLLDPSEVIRGHSLAPRFLRDQIERSRRNLRLETLDYYLIEEPEIWLRELGADGFRKAVLRAFEALEQAVADGAIGAYGVASWDGFLLPDSDRSHLSLVDFFDAALEVGLADHHFRAVQLPFGLAMGEGAVAATQLGPDGLSRATLDHLRDTGTAVFTSAPLYGGRLLGRVPEFVRKAFPEAPSEATAALQFVRSNPNVTTVVTSMRDPAHVADNLRLAKIPRADPTLPGRLFAAAQDPQPGEV